MNILNDKEVIKKIANHLDLNVTEWPDERNRNTKDIDAIADNFAIEHTSIDTIDFQRRNDAWFMEAIGDLEKELNEKLSFRLSITIPYESIKQGQDWNKIKKAMLGWITQKSPYLSEGNKKIQDIPNIPFNFHIRKEETRPPGLFFSSFSPNDKTLHTRIRELFDRKAKKLSKYKNNGKVTILLIETRDIALMNESILTDAIKKAYSKNLPIDVDKIWYADTALQNNIIFKDLTSAISV